MKSDSEYVLKTRPINRRGRIVLRGSVYKDDQYLPDYTVYGDNYTDVIERLAQKLAERGEP